MKPDGYYYLHKNGDLIYKHFDEGRVSDFRDSDFVVFFWPCYLTERAGCWQILVEASSLGASKKRINELAEKWGCNDDDALIYAERIGVNLFKDVAHWCATRLDFKDIQNDQCGFGATCLDALVELCKDLKFAPCKLNWHHSFSELVKKELAND